MVSAIAGTLIKTDKLADYTPVISSLVNLVNLIQKCFILPCMSQYSIEKNYYYTYLNNKSYIRTTLLLIPFLGNILIAFYDLSTRKDKPPISKKESGFTSSLPATLQKHAISALDRIRTYSISLQTLQPNVKGVEKMVFDALSTTGKALRYGTETLRTFLLTQVEKREAVGTPSATVEDPL